MNAGEYGSVLYINLRYDVSDNSGNDGLQIEVTKPDGTVVTFNKASTNPVEIVSVQTAVEDEKGREYTIEANQGIKRTWANGDIDQDGDYTIRATYNNGSLNLLTDELSFYVDP